MIQIQGYDNPTTYEHLLNRSSNTAIRGYPTTWGEDGNYAHWGPYGNYAPTMRVLFNEADGTRLIYHTTKNNWTFEHTSGYHHAITGDAAIENVPRRKMSYVGGGGHSETINGHHDMSRQGHYRENNACDTYCVTKGVAHHFTAQGKVAVNMGNETSEHHGNVKTRILGAGKGWGVGVGMGDGNYHDNMMHISDKRMYFNAHTGSDMVLQTSSNNISVASGKQYNVVASESINTQSGSDQAHKAGGAMALSCGSDGNWQAGGKIVFAAPQDMYVGPKNHWIAGISFASAFIVAINSKSPNVPGQPDTPPSPPAGEALTS